MNSIINIEEYRELLRQHKVKELLTATYIFLVVAIIELIIAVVISLSEENGFFEAGIYMLIPFGLIFILFLITYFVYRNTMNKPFDSFVFQAYKDYEPKGVKIPLYRVVSTGNSSQTIFMLMDIHGDEFDLFDVRKKSLKPYLTGSMKDLTFKFFYKDKRGIEYLKPKLFLLTSRKTYRIQGMVEVLDRLIVYVKSEAYNLEIDNK